VDSKLCDKNSLIINSSRNKKSQFEYSNWLLRYILKSSKKFAIIIFFNSNFIADLINTIDYFPLRKVGFITIITHADQFDAPKAALFPFTTRKVSVSNIPETPALNSTPLVYL